MRVRYCPDMDTIDELSNETVSGLRTLSQDPRITELLRERLDQLVPLRERFDRLRRDGPTSDSEAARDGVTKWGAWRWSSPDCSGLAVATTS